VQKQLIQKDDVLEMIKQRDFDVLIVLGAGDLDNQVPQMARLLQKKIC
jgi:UDP-N-acetylmuramate--alanine ligase